ncbi:MAG TPA: family 10 glycosylhydrolase [Longimicrobiales bacterium]
MTFKTIRRFIVLAAGLSVGCASTANPIASTTGGPPPVEREFRGVWVAAVSNIDWPSRPGLPVDSQKAELIRQLDRSKQLGLNAFILHVRPAGDALYDSKLEPWSEYLTGTQGQAPEPFYDPLEFAVREAHARGLELHAWFNPYRARHPSARGELAPTHIARTQPELVKQYGNYLWMDPGEDAVRNRTVAVIADVTRRYDVDGVHIDDYFYPYRERGPDGKELDFPDSASYAKYRAGGGKLDRSDWRRSNVDRFVAQMYEAVKKEKPWVKVGISPIGTWRPNVTPQTRGFDAYESIFADARKWFMDGDLDYFVPQLYWPIARTDVSFPILLDWWTRQNPRKRALYAGMIPGNVRVNNWPGDEIIGQIYVTRAHAGVHGHVHFSMRSLMPEGAFTPIAGADTIAQTRLDSINTIRERTQARRDSMTGKMMREAYGRPALIPAMPWLDNKAPRAPTATLQRVGDTTQVAVTPGRGEPASLWVVQSKWPRGWWWTQILPASQREWPIVAPAADWGAPVEVWVSAVDRVGNQSPAVRARADGAHFASPPEPRR